MVKLRSNKLLEFIEAVCKANEWQTPPIVFVEVGNDFVYKNVLHINLESDLDCASEVMQHITDLLSDLFEVRDPEINEVHLCESCFKLNNN